MEAAASASVVQALAFNRAHSLPTRQGFFSPVLSLHTPPVLQALLESPQPWPGLSVSGVLLN